MYRFFLLLAVFVFVPPQSLFAQTFYPFQGEIDFDERKIEAAFNPGGSSVISLSISQQSDSELVFSMNLDQVHLPVFTVSTLLSGTIHIQKNAKGETAYAGTITSKYSMVNDKPIDELAGRFSIKNSTVIVEAFSVGNITCSGTVAFTDGKIRPNLTFNLYNVGLQDFIAFWYGGQIIPSAGLVNGKIEVSGDFERLNLKGQLASETGYVKGLEFDNMHFNAEGIYPLIALYDSNITDISGVIFEVQGQLNLADSQNFKKQILALSKLPLVSNSEFKSEWTLKRMRDEDHSGATELKYMMKKRSALDYANEEDGAVLGIERKIAF